MRGYVLLPAIFFLFLSVNQVNAMAADPVDTVVRYFEACRNGDVETMKSLIAGHFYDNKKDLLLKNREYPEFLKNYYRDVGMTIVFSSIGNVDRVAEDHPRLYERYHRNKDYSTVEEFNGIGVVTVLFKFPDGSSFNTKLLLKKNDMDIWKIYEQLLND